MTNTTHQPATERQVAYATSLLLELAALGVTGYAEVDLDTISRNDISRLIDIAKADLATARRLRAKTVPASVPAGHYATASRTGNNDLDFWTVDCPTEGKWAGYTFVSRVIGGHEDQRVRGAEAAKALAAIEAAGPEEAAKAYGRAIGRCGRCNRHLTDETSRALGLGPECASKF
jgi:hypothetical protein